MPRTVDHIVATHQLAQQRRDAGLPIWDRKLNLSDVFHNDAMTFTESRDAIVRIIRASGWPDRNSTVYALLDEIADAETTDEFDAPWDLIYDEADADRVWIQTR
jgi:hypothetical protein